MRFGKKRVWLIPAFLLVALIPLSQLRSQAQQEKVETKSSTAGQMKNATPKTARETAKPTPKAGSDAAKPAPKNGASNDEDGWVNGRAEQLEEDRKAGKRVLTGNVQITQENSEDYLYADRVTQFFNPDDKDSTVLRTLAEGNVRMKEEDIIATCNEAEFTDDNNIIDLRGAVVVLQGESRLEAEKFNYNRITGKRIGSGGVRFRVKIAKRKPEEPPSPTAENGFPNGEKESAATPTSAQ